MGRAAFWLKTAKYKLITEEHLATKAFMIFDEIKEGSVQ